MISNITPEQYDKEVKKDWTEFVADGRKAENASVSKEILSSWERCLVKGVDPYNTDLYNWIITNWSNSGSLIQKDNLFGNLLGENASLAVFDQYANNLLWDDTVCMKNFSEIHVGTNAVALAIKYRRGFFVRGAEHYLEAMQNLYMYAKPFCKNNSEVAGVIAGTTKNSDKIQDLARYVDMLCNIGEVIYRLKESKSLKGVITDMMNAIPKGLAYIDKDNILKYYNKKLLETLDITDSSSADARVLQNIALLQNLLETDHQLVTANNNGKEKDVYFTLRNLAPSNEDYRRLIIVEDKSILLKGNNSINRAAYNLDDIIGNCDQMKKAKEIVNVVAFENVPVMIYGESGCGKELFAHSIHASGDREEKPFMAINCGTIPENLIESELFGYEKGAFTGANQRGKIGLFEAANNGTIFLDEIDSMPYPVQVKLLRTLSTGKIQRVGGLKEIPINTRIVSATKIDLLELAKQGKFREDLYYRLMVVPIYLPPLRDRGEDVLTLAKLFLNKYCQRLGKTFQGMTEAFADRLMLYPWYGNVRELKHAMEYCAAFLEKDGQFADVDTLPENIKHFDPNNPENIPIKVDDNEQMNRLEFAEYEIIKEVYEKFDRNASKTAKALGISINTVYSRIRSAGKGGA